MNRPTPDEGAVRDAFREEESAVGSRQSAEEKDEDLPTADSGPPTEEPAAEEDELAVAQRERDQYLDLAKRAQADFENYRKRAAKDVAASGARARAGLIRELLPVVDNLERALSSAP